MRKAFVEALIALAEKDERVFLLTADLGWSVLEPFAQKFPKRFLNVGVAEANMMGVAAGLAQAGYVPYAYSIATFASMRGYEQTRNGALLHGLPVKVVGIGGGFAYGHAGPTHFALEDLPLARCQPGMTTVAPADPAQAKSAVATVHALPGAAYFRIGKGGDKEVPGLGGRFALGRPEVVREGRDLLFLTCGGVALEALGAADLLAAEGRPSPAVAVMAHLPLLPGPALSALLSKYKAVITVEEGYTAGGLASLAAEALAPLGSGTRLWSAGVTRSLEGASGSQGYMRSLHGLDAPSLARLAKERSASL